MRTRVNEIEAMYERPRVKGKLSKVQLLRLRVTFHTLPQFYLRAFTRKNYAILEIHPNWKSKRMLATNMRRMGTKNVKIRIAGSCCRPKKKRNNNRPFPHSAPVSLGRQFHTNHCILPTQASSWCLFFTGIPESSSPNEPYIPCNILNF